MRGNHFYGLILLRQCDLYCTFVCAWRVFCAGVYIVYIVNTNLQTPSFFLSPSVSVHWVRYLETARSQLCQFDQYWHCVYSVCRCATAAHTCMFEFVRLITLGFCSNRAEVFVSLALGVCECARISVRVWLQCVRFRFLWRSLNVCVVWMHGCSIQTILFALPVPALDGGSSVSLACLM